MNPARWQKYSITSMDVEPITVFHLVAQKNLAMIFHIIPFFVFGQVLFGGLDQIKYFVAFDRMIPISKKKFEKN